MSQFATKDSVGKPSTCDSVPVGLSDANTYYLAFRDLPEILSAHVTGPRALDFGCGTGRSTRILRKLGFDVTGVDVSEAAGSRAPRWPYV